MPGGKGAYTKGNLSLPSTTNLFVYVGQCGDNVTNQTATNTLEINDGIHTWLGSYPKTAIFNNGFASYVVNEKWICAGGGATDIRVTDGDWNNATSLQSRIMVAAGGAGTMFYNEDDNGGDAGAYTGYSGAVSGNDGTAATGGTQSKGGKHGTGLHSHSDTDYGLTTDGYAAFGQTKSYKVCGSGGGGGWYCGGNGAHGQGTTGSGGGGSSYISGHSDCAAANTTYVFNNTEMVDGKGYKWTNTSTKVSTTTPAHIGFTSQAGHTGNGYARITLTRW